MLNKRGVVTVFIIAGILIVGLVIGIYYTKDYILRSEWDKLRKQPVPEQAQGVKDFVDSCVKSVGEEAVRLVGMQAGYIEVPGDPIMLSRVNIFSNGLVVGGSLKVPYWLYEQANGVIKEQIPSKEKIENEISNYINNNLKSCLDEFKDFKDYKIKEGIIETETEIQDDNVLFYVKYPLHVELKDFKFDFNGFYEKVDVPLGELYDIAKEVYYKEKNDMFLEEKTIDWMGLYSEEIPTNGIKRSCVSPIWFKVDVINNFKEMLFNNIQFLKLKKGNYVLADESHKRFVLDIKGRKDVDVNFMFSKDWPFGLEVFPEENGLLKAQSVTEGLGKARSIAESFVCLSTWHFVYNIKYPVLVVLSKNDYMFQFALHVVIDRNEPRKSTFVKESFPIADRKICENRQNEVSVYTIDEEGNPLDGVDIKYKCINHICDIGKTRLDSYGDASLIERFPVCVNGFVIGSKEGYHVSKEVFSSVSGGSLTLELEKFRDIMVDVVVERAGSGEVRENENVLISMEELEKEYGVVVNYPSQKNIKLIPGNYKVEIYMVSNYPEKIKIPEKIIKRCVEVPKKGIHGLFGAKEEKCFDTKIPSVELSNFISGYSKFNLRISESDLLKKKIVFYVPYKKPSSLEDLSLVFEGGEFTKPKFVD